MSFLDALKGKKTVIINSALVLLAGLAYLFPTAELPTPEAISQTFDLTVNGAVGVVAIVNLILRAVTTTSIFRSTSD